jgi:LytS/YehU family sensor histidine kinase
VGYAHKEGKEGSSLTMIGLLITALIMLVLPSQFMERYLFLSFGILALFILGSLTLSLRKQQHEHEAALLNSSRLEIELLKKNIQPHFILNTLTAVEEWIEESPKTAIQFIDSLANEFRIMSTMASKKLVPLKQELALCHSHLEIMSYRKGIKFELKIDIENHVDIPPACIHTLIENAISHNPYREGTIQFELKQIIDKTNINFIFKAPRYAKKQDTQAHSATIGTGLKYIQARLEESFSGKWKFTEEHDDNFWTTTISLPLERR